MHVFKKFRPGGRERLSMVPVEPEILGQGVKTIHVGLTGANDVTDQFVANGYRLRYQSPWEKLELQPQDLGVKLDPRFPEGSDHDLIVANLTGIEQPKRHEFEDVFDLPGPVVAKNIFIDRGDAVFYLDSPEELAKFAMANYRLYMGIASDQPFLPARRIREARRRLAQGDWEWEGFRYLTPDSSWIFQDYIETPSDFYTSFRILVDGYGHIHAGTLLRSPEKKGVRKLDFSDNLNIVSNSAQGGVDIFLNGERIEDETNRRIAVAHNIDPDNPQIPEDMERDAITIGKATQRYSPITGIDFIKDLTLKHFMLEINPLPGIVPGEVGVSQEELATNVSDIKNQREVMHYLYNVLIRKIAEQAPK